MLEVDDFFYVGADGRASLGSVNDIVGLEEQIEREERSEERMASTRAKMEATRKAVCEALVLWSKKADLLQVGFKYLGYVTRGPGLLRQALVVKIIWRNKLFQDIMAVPCMPRDRLAKHHRKF